MLDKCPVAWSDTYGGHWVAAGHPEVFELARSADYLSNDHDPAHERRGYKGISIPAPDVGFRGGFLGGPRAAALPACSTRTCRRDAPMGTACVDDLVRAEPERQIEPPDRPVTSSRGSCPRCSPWGCSGSAEELDIYVEPIHASVYTSPNSPNIARIQASRLAMRDDMMGQLGGIRANPRPGLIDALATAEINGTVPPDFELLGVIALLMGGGFDTTTALTSRSLEWLSEHPADRAPAVGRAGHAAQPGDGGVPALLHPGPRRRAHHLGRLRDRGAAVQGGRADLAVVGDVQPRPRGLPQPQRG